MHLIVVLFDVFVVLLVLLLVVLFWVFLLVWVCVLVGLICWLFDFGCFAVVLWCCLFGW